MTTLTPFHGHFNRAQFPLHRPETVRADAVNMRLAMLKRFYFGALAILLAGGLVATIIGLRTAIYFWRFGI